VLVVNVAAPKQRFIGRPVAYTVTVSNTGDGVARDAMVSLRLPSGAKVISVGNGGKASMGSVVWNVGNIAPKAAKKLALTLAGTSRGVLRPTVSAKAHCAEATGQASTLVQGIPAILLECVDLEDPIEVGAQEVYLITVTNQGSADGTNIVITATLPTQQAFVSATGPTKHTVVEKTTTFAPLAKLEPGEKQTYRIVVKGVAAGDTRFRVSLTSDQMDSPAEETESTHIYE